MAPNILAPGTGFMEDNFPMDWGGGEDGFRMIQVNYLSCALCFCYYYISTTSGHQALDPGVGDPWQPHSDISGLYDLNNQ